MKIIFYLVAVDVSGIQDYVFRTNALKHHIGASEITRLVTESWVKECLPNPNNMRGNGEILSDDETGWIENGLAKAEAIYCGGGNALILFADEASAQECVKKLTRKVLLEAPGLLVHIVMKNYEWKEGGDDLGRTVKSILGEDMRSRKQTPPLDGGLLGLSVTADCEFTGLPAVGREEESDGLLSRRISAEIDAKIQYSSQANTRLGRDIPDVNFIFDFDEIGNKGESSYMAVIHADGNRIGKLFEDLGEGSRPNRVYILQARALSRSTHQASLNALRDTVEDIVNSRDADGRISGQIALRDRKLPFRPIIFGGDDATFVCDGRLGLAVAAKYLEHFSEQKLTTPNGDISPTARAGIAIVNTHHPFGKAYKLAEDLGKSAKKFTDEGAHNAMDWHFGINGVTMSLRDIRERDYHSSDTERLSLLMRPIQINGSSTEWRRWDIFAKTTYELQNTANYPRNKVKALREALRNGRSKAKDFIEANFSEKGKTLPPILTHDPQGGWIGDYYNAYFDPIEALDFFIPLEPHGER